MRKYLKHGVVTDQASIIDLMVEDYYQRGKSEIDFRKLYNGANNFPANDRKKRAQRLSAKLAGYLVNELVEALIEKNCIFLFPIGKILLSIRSLTQDGRKIYRPCLDIIDTPSAWRRSLISNIDKGKLIMVKFGSSQFQRMVALLKNNKRYREKNDVYGF